MSQLRMRRAASVRWGDDATGVANDAGGEDDQYITPMVDEATASDVPMIDSAER